MISLLRIFKSRTILRNVSCYLIIINEFYAINDGNIIQKRFAYLTKEGVNVEIKILLNSMG